eukprot:494247-Rhodomonas_salina.2
MVVAIICQWPVERGHHAEAHALCGSRSPVSCPRMTHPPPHHHHQQQQSAALAAAARRITPPS